MVVDTLALFLGVKKKKKKRLLNLQDKKLWFFFFWRMDRCFISHKIIQIKLEIMLIWMKWVCAKTVFLVRDDRREKCEEKGRDIVLLYVLHNARIKRNRKCCYRKTVSQWQGGVMWPGVKRYSIAILKCVCVFFFNQFVLNKSHPLTQYPSPSPKSHSNSNRGVKHSNPLHSEVHPGLYPRCFCVDSVI